MFEGLLGGINQAAMSPMVLAGLGLLGGGGSQGAMQGVQTGLLAQKQTREEAIRKQREQAFAQLMQDPKWSSGLPHAAVPIAGAMGSEAALPFLGGLLTKKGDNEHAMALFEKQKGLQFGLERQKMEYQKQLAMQERMANAQLVQQLFPGMLPGSTPGGSPGQPPGMLPGGAPPAPKGLLGAPGGQSGPEAPGGLLAPAAEAPGQPPMGMSQRPMPQPVSPQAAGVVGMMTGAKPELMKLLTQQDPATEAVEKGRGEGLAKRYNTLAEDAVTANADMATLQHLNQLNNNVSPGSRTALLEKVRRMTGVALDPNATNVQAFGAALEYMVPRMRVPGSGASSDRDMESFRASLPSLLGTPGGNELALQTLGGMSQRKIAAGEVAAAWQRGEIAAKDADARLRSLPDPFESYRKWQEGQKTTQPQAAKGGRQMPKAGEVRNGWRFKGGDPAAQTSWEKVQ